MGSKSWLHAWQRDMLAVMTDPAGNVAPPLGGLSGAPAPSGSGGLSGAATREDIVRGYELVIGVDTTRRGKMLPVTFGPEGARFDQPLPTWQKPWTGHYDPMSFHPDGSWYGRGVSADAVRPLTVSGLVSAIMRGQSEMGGTSASRWELTRELASEFATDPAWVVQGLMPGLGIMDDMEAGILKVCGVPIVLEKTTQEMLSKITRKAFAPATVSGVDTALGKDETHAVTQAAPTATWCDNSIGALQLRNSTLEDEVSRLRQDVQKAISANDGLHRKIAALKSENEWLRDVADVALKAANPLLYSDGTMVEVARSFFAEHYDKAAKAPAGCPQGFGAPDPAPAPTVAVQPPKPPIPMRALSNDRQPIGLHGWK